MDQIEDKADNSNTVLPYQLFILNEDLNDKLKLLASQPTEIRPISRHYFATSTNVGEQFFTFVTLSTWLIRKALNPDFSIPHEFDDPNATISNILNELRKKEIEVDFAPNKLKSGSGEHCLYVLDKLADLALMVSGFSWNKVTPTEDDDQDVDIGTDEAELTVEQFDDENESMEEAADEDEGFFVNLQQTPLSADNAVPALEGILRGETDSNLWKMEVERVTPQLKITLRQNTKDWRMHIDQIRKYRNKLESLLLSTRPNLKSISEELEKSLQRISLREKHLNGQLDSLFSLLRSAKDTLAEAKEKYKEASAGIIQRNDALKRICDDIDQLKMEIDEQGQRNSDGAPTLRVKQAIQKLDTDITTMNVQIAVIAHFLLQSQLKNRFIYANELI